MKKLMVAMVLLGVSAGALAEDISSPGRGVVCDKKAGFCVDHHGIAMGLTGLYLGRTAEEKLKNTLSGDVNLSEYTFSNGVHCDSKEMQCYKDRYYPRTPDKRDHKMTQQIFGQK